MIIALAEINSWKAGYLQINIITWSLSFSSPYILLGISQKKKNPSIIPILHIFLYFFGMSIECQFTVENFF